MGERLKSVGVQLRDYYALTKPEVNLLILMATSGGYVLGSVGPLRYRILVRTLVGTLLVASGTATLNQWMERQYDALMRRTRNRPLPAERLHPTAALGFGVLLSITGVLFLLLLVNTISACIAGVTLLSYLLIYTPLKRKTPLCTAIGAIPGAMPILIGWSAATGGLELRAWLLFGVLFLWQFPHFLAIALLYREDYREAGYRMIPDFDTQGGFTRAEILAFTVALLLVSMAFVAADKRGAASVVGLMCVGGFLLHSGVRLARLKSKVAAGRLLHATVVYLPIVLAIFVRHKY